MSTCDVIQIPIRNYNTPFSKLYSMETEFLSKDFFSHGDSFVFSASIRKKGEDRLSRRKLMFVYSAIGCGKKMQTVVFNVSRQAKPIYKKYNFEQNIKNISCSLYSIDSTNIDHPSQLPEKSDQSTKDEAGGNVFSPKSPSELYPVLFAISVVLDDGTCFVIIEDREEFNQKREDKEKIKNREVVCSLFESKDICCSLLYERHAVVTKTSSAFGSSALSHIVGTKDGSLYLLSTDFNNKVTKDESLPFYVISQYKSEINSAVSVLRENEEKTRLGVGYLDGRITIFDTSNILPHFSRNMSVVKQKKLIALWEYNFHSGIIYDIVWDPAKAIDGKESFCFSCQNDSFYYVEADIDHDEEEREAKEVNMIKISPHSSFVVSLDFQRMINRDERGNDLSNSVTLVSASRDCCIAVNEYNNTKSDSEEDHNDFISKLYGPFQSPVEVIRLYENVLILIQSDGTISIYTGKPN